MRTLCILLLALFLSACARSGARVLDNVSRRADALAAGDGGIAVPRVYFSFDSDEVLPGASAGIGENIAWMGENPSAYIILEGHCDETGPKEYNMELGDRRGRSVEAYLIEHGIPLERIIMVVSYGEGRPLSVGHRVEDLRKNRRVEFVVR